MAQNFGQPVRNIQSHPTPTLFETGNGFDPAIIPGLKLWLRADNALTSIANNTPAEIGDSVEMLVDKTGNGNNYSQTTATRRPTVSTLNGRLALSFDGIDDMLEGNVSARNLVRKVAGTTQFVVAKGVSGSVVFIQTLIVFSASGASTRTVLRRISPDTYQLGARRLDTDAFTTIQGGTTNNAPFVACGIWDYANASAQLAVNGTVVANSTSFLTPGETSNTASGNTRLGSGGGNPGGGTGENYWPGLMAEWLLWQRVLNPSEISIVTNGLRNYYNF